jgi:hypothetical protein
MILRLQPVRIANRHDDDGRLVFQDDRLLALLVRLSAMHEEKAGHWFLEFGFDGLEDAPHETFADLDAAVLWIKARSNEP